MSNYKKKNNPPVYSVVVPVYESSKSLEDLVTRLQNIFEHTLKNSFEIILVDDGSKSSSTRKVLLSITENQKNVKTIRLMKNYGKSNAVLCGFSHARGKWIITIDDDLQHLPEDIPAMVEYDTHDVVVANFKKKQHSLITKLASWMKYYFDKRILGLPCRMSPFKLIKAEVIKGILNLNRPRPYIPALIAQATSDIVPVVVQHEKSKRGKSRYTLFRRFSQFSNLIIGNSSFLLKILGVIGGLLTGSGFFFMLYNFTASSSNQEFLKFIVSIGSILVGIILIGLWIIGEYLFRILEAVNGKPAYVVREIITKHSNEHL